MYVPHAVCALLSLAPAPQLREVSENPLAKLSRKGGGPGSFMAGSRKGSGVGSEAGAGGAGCGGGLGCGRRPTVGRAKSVKALETQVLESSIHKICSLLSVRCAPWVASWRCCTSTGEAWSCAGRRRLRRCWAEAQTQWRRAAGQRCWLRPAGLLSRSSCLPPALSHCPAPAGGLWRGWGRGDCRQHAVWRRPEPHGAGPQGGSHLRLLRHPLLHGWGGRGWGLEWGWGVGGGRVGMSVTPQGHRRHL